MITERALADIIYRRCFAAFVHSAFVIVHPGQAIRPNWHIDALCTYLQDMCDGRQPRQVVINLPPRTLKTFIISVCLPAWLLLLDPTREIVVATYGDELSKSIAAQFRTLVHADFVVRLSRGKLAEPLRSTETEYLTQDHGGRYATSVGGPLTGRGVHVLIVDDPLKADEASSEAARSKAINWFNNTAHSRQNEPGKAIMILAMQRLHTEDLSGHLIERNWPTFILPQKATQTETYDVGAGLYVRPAGELLQPGWDTENHLKQTRGQIGSYLYSAQYQQNPVPAAGNMIKREWLPRYAALPNLKSCSQVYLTCDPSGKAGATNDYTAMVVAGVKDRGIYIAEARRGHWDSLQIKSHLEDLAQQWKPTSIIIETTGQGESVRQEIARNGRLDIKGVMQKLDKQTRLSRTIMRFEAGRIFLPENESWLADFEAEVLGFPGAKYDDQLDALLMVLEDVAERERDSFIPEFTLDVSFGRRPNPFDSERFSNRGWH